MKLLLTSAGIQNDTLRKALLEMLGKPFDEARALCIPTAIHAIPDGPAHAWKFLSGTATTPMCELGWKSMGVLELTALPSVDPKCWLPMLQSADVLLVNGGDPLYLCHWMRKSGLAALLPTLPAVYVGLSAGSMVMTPRIGADFIGWRPPVGEAADAEGSSSEVLKVQPAVDETLGFVDFSIFPHLDHVMLPDNNMAAAEKWAADLTCPSYAIDDQTAIRVVDGKVDVLSEGKWRRFEPGAGSDEEIQ